MNGIIVDQRNTSYKIGKFAYIHVSDMVSSLRGLYALIIPCPEPMEPNEALNTLHVPISSTQQFIDLVPFDLITNIAPRIAEKPQR